MNERIALNVSLTLIGPVLTQTSSAPAYGVDAPMAKSRDGRYYLPGTLVKGRLRQAWEELHDILEITNNDIEKHLGSKSGNRQDGAAVASGRGAMQFSDFLTPSGTANRNQYRIRMDEARGAVATGAYLVIEAPFEPGEEVTFCGTISFFAGSDEIQRIGKLIEAGLKWNLSFGAERTIGFGRLKEIAIIESAGKKNADPPLIMKDFL